MKAKKGGIRLLLILPCLFFLVYFVYQAYMAVSPSYKTEIALRTDVTDSVSVTGLVLRDETVVEAPSGGLFGYRFADGDKVPSGAVIADVYSSIEAAENARMYEKLSDIVKTYSYASDSGRTAGSNLTNLRSRIYRELSSISNELALQRLSGAYDGSLEMVTLLSSYIYASGGEADFSAALGEAQGRLAAYGEGSFASSEISAPVEGYFISSLDGYEGELSAQDAQEAAASQIAALVSRGEDREGGEGCKLVSDYRWYFATLLSAETAGRLEEGDSVNVDFSFSALEPLPMQLVRLEAASEGEVLALFECDYLNSELCKLRHESALLRFSSYSGVRVSRSALRLVDGALGVYIKYGSAVRFRTVKVIYETDDYVISSVDSGDASRLAYYDEIIVSGRDLYEGKQLTL